MGARRVPHERERWLSAVLIVTLIAATTAGVRQWPRAGRPDLPAVPVRPLPPVDAPLVLREVVPDADVSPSAPAETMTAFDRIPAAPPPPPDSASGPVPAASDDRASVLVAATTPLLASRRVELGFTAPGAGTSHAVAHPGTSEKAAAADSASLVERPAVVMTRAFTVAGRGIRTGLRATSAMLRAAF